MYSLAGTDTVLGYNLFTYEAAVFFNVIENKGLNEYLQEMDGKAGDIQGRLNEKLNDKQYIASLKQSELYKEYTKEQIIRGAELAANMLEKGTILDSNGIITENGVELFIALDIINNIAQSTNEVSKGFDIIDCVATGAIPK